MFWLIAIFTYILNVLAAIFMVELSVLSASEFGLQGF